MDFKTQTIKTKEYELTNDIENGVLSYNGKTYPSILSIEGNIVTLKQSNAIFQTSTADPRLKQIIEILLNPPKKTTKKSKTSKTTIKGKTSKTTIKGKKEDVKDE